MTPVFICLTAPSAATAHSLRTALSDPSIEIHGLAGRLDADQVDHLFADTMAHVRTLFQDQRPILGLCASGILIRALAPLLQDKQEEPPVLALSPDGKICVPLLGGHHGANDWARRIADMTGGSAAITTASDSLLGFSLDAPPEGWRLTNPDAAKPMMAAILDGQGIRLDRPLGDLGWPPSSFPQDPHGSMGLIVTDQTIGQSDKDRNTQLVVHPPMLALGVGCERDCPAEDLITLVAGLLAKNGYARGAIACVVSIDVKADEPAVHTLAEHLSVPVRFFSAARLEQETPRLHTPSDIVFQEVGCHGVAEGAALAAVGSTGSLMVAKHKGTRCTAALARATTPLDPAIIGHPQGRLAIVGIGPGTDQWRTPDASRAITEATDLVGYGLYLDLLGSATAGKRRHDSPLGEETERARLALQLAATGRSVALVCSGDAGIYALATLVFEVLELDGGSHPEFGRVDIRVCPGISALQAAAARSGAPLGHDFCAISLSDLLTPKEVILQRLKAAAEGDFVIAFYNPVSKRRRTLLESAKSILLESRPTDTPVVLARNLGRADETLRVVSLESLEVDMVDMLTLVMVGSRTTRAIGPWVYTPRGYAKKRTTDPTGGPA